MAAAREARDASAEHRSPGHHAPSRSLSGTPRTSFRYEYKFSLHEHLEQKSQRRVLSGGPREKCSPAKLEKKCARRFEQQLLLERHFQGCVPFCSSKGSMSQTAIGSPTTGGSKAAAAPSSAAGQSVNKRCVPRPPAWLDPRIRSSEHLRTARRQRLPGAPERARRVRCLPCPTELRHRSRSPGGSLVPPPPGCKRSS